MDKKQLKEETVHGTVKFPLAVYRQDADERFVVKLHWHEETEIILLEQGKFIIDINMKKIKIQEQALVFIGSGDIHSIHGEAGCRESAVVFDMEMLSFEHFDGIQYSLITPLLEKRMQFPQIITAKSSMWGAIFALYNEIQKEAIKANTASGIRVKAYLYEMMACLYESGSFVNMEIAGKDDSVKIENIKKVLWFIQENYSKKILIQDMALLLQMNEQYFCRYFKKITGKTPTRYINECRIEKAAGFLQGSSRKIIDIAMECGYENMGYFIKRFKEQKGVLPSEYREKSQNSIINSHNY